MAGIDIFNNDAFSTFELTAALDKIPYVPSMLDSMGIFETRPVRTTFVAIEKRESTLQLVPVTPRGAPLPQYTPGPRDLRNFNTVRVAKGDRINASELQNVRQFGTDTELAQVQTEIARRMAAVRTDVELTHEHMRLGALQGLLLDADGSVLYNFFTEWGIAQPAEIDFDLDNAAPAQGALRKKCKAVIRTMQKAAKGAWSPATRIVALAGDDFWDALIATTEAKFPYEQWLAAENLREAAVWDTFRFGGIDWINYRGTDTGDVGIPTDKAKFFPTNAPGAFLRVNSPGESEDWVNTLGQDFYAITVSDRDRRMWTDVEVYSYPLYVPTRPEMLLRARMT